jgi:hypothetical protein
MTKSKNMQTAVIAHAYDRLIGDRLSREFPLSWSHDVLLVRRVESPEARTFYETEALRGGWSVRQLDCQRNASKLLERRAR